MRTTATRIPKAGLDAAPSQDATLSGHTDTAAQAGWLDCALATSPAMAAGDAEERDANRRADIITGRAAGPLAATPTQVRIHTGPAAEAAAAALDARAFALGQDIVFGRDEYRPGTPQGAWLLAHEMAHVQQQAAHGPRVQRFPRDQEVPVRPVPGWAQSTPMAALDGDRVADFAEPAAYTEADRTRLLAALNERVQLNAVRLEHFFDDLLAAWIDLVIELAVDDSGFGLGAQTLASVITGLIGATMSAGTGLVVGILMDGIVNIADELQGQADQDQKKKSLRDMLQSSQVQGSGLTSMRGRLTGMLADAVGYTAWLMSASLDDLHKFRIPYEFPPVAAADIRFAIAHAVLGYRSPPLRQDVLARAWELHGLSPYLYGDDFLQVSVGQGLETQLAWTLSTHPALLAAVRGHRIGELNGLPLILHFGGLKPADAWDPDYEHAGMVMISRSQFGEVRVEGGNFVGLAQLDSYRPGADPPPTYNDVHVESHGPGQYRMRDDAEVQGITRALRAGYIARGEQNARRLLAEYVDPFYLPFPAPRAPGLR